MNPSHSLVSKRANGRCEYCHAPEKLFNFNLDVDHFLPIAAGGSDDLENLVLACRSCNSYKAFHQLGLTDDFSSEPLFNPRVDTWSDHFEFDAETGVVKGLTGIGRGTINRLKLNSELQTRARRLWIEMGVITESLE